MENPVEENRRFQYSNVYKRASFAASGYLLPGVRPLAGKETWISSGRGYANLLPGWLISPGQIEFGCPGNGKKNTVPDPYFRSIITPASRDAWEELARRDADTMVFQQPAWMDALASTAGHEDASRQYETHDGRTLILPLVRRVSFHPALSSLASLPDGWGMGGVLASQAFRPEDAAHILRELSGLPGYKISLRANPLQTPVWAAAGNGQFSRMERKTHILDLEGGFETVWSKRFPTATRTKIRKAEKAGLDIVVGAGGDLLDSFYDVYLHWIDRRAEERKIPRFLARWLGKRREPLAKFQAAAKALGPAFQVWLARLDGQPIAAAILLVGRRQAVYWRSASLKEPAGRTRANDLLQRCMVETACQAGCRYYHMGESGGVASLIHFKERFGAQPHSYPVFYRERLPVDRAKQTFSDLTRRIERQIVKE